MPRVSQQYWNSLELVMLDRHIDLLMEESGLSREETIDKWVPDYPEKFISYWLEEWREKKWYERPINELFRRKKKEA